MEYININGINNESNAPEPDSLEVDICIKYLKFIKENSKYNKITTSYDLKHIIDKEDIYVSNDSFIKALNILKLSYKRCSENSTNVWVKFNSSDLIKAILYFKINSINLKKCSSDNLLTDLIDRSRIIGFRHTVKEIELIINEFTGNNKISTEYVYKLINEIKMARFFFHTAGEIDFKYVYVNISPLRLRTALRIHLKEGEVLYP